jgi:hypothetical protein
MSNYTCSNQKHGVEVSTGLQLAFSHDLSIAWSAAGRGQILLQGVQTGICAMVLASQAQSRHFQHVVWRALLLLIACCR